MAAITENDASALDSRIHLAFRYWHAPARDDGLLTDLLALAVPAPDAPIDPRTRTNDFLREALARLAADQPVDAELLAARFIERIPADQVALKLKFAESTIFMKQNQAIKRLARVVAEMEADAWRDRQRRVDDRIPVPATGNPIGHDVHLDQLLDLLNGAEPPWIISLEGIGGIGKTTLAAALARRAAATSTFADFGWVSAKAGILDLGGAIRAVPQPALTVRALVGDLLRQLAPDAAESLLANPEHARSFLRSRLKQTPHLIVIDNLETVADLEALAPALLTMADPSRFVLTSRKRLVDERGIYLYPVPELSERDALALVRQEATLRNLPDVAGAPDADLRPIVATVGGNPLALLLVVGLTHVHSLTVVLRHLREARGLPAENLYTYIYRQAWDALDERDRHVLLAMPLTSVRGETLEFVAAICDQPPAVTADALHRLYTLNLVTASGDLHQRRYAIHSLTRTFLQEQVARWL